MESASIFREDHEMKKVSSLAVLLRQMGQWHEHREQPEFPILAEYMYKGTKITGTFGHLNGDVVQVDVKTYEVDPELLKPHVEKLLCEGTSFQTYQGHEETSRPMTWTIEYIAENIYELARHIIVGVNPIQYGDRSILRTSMPEGSHVDLSSHDPQVTEQEIMPHVISLINRGKPFTVGTGMTGGNPQITFWSIEYTATNVGDLAQRIAAGNAPIKYGNEGRMVRKANAPESGHNDVLICGKDVEMMDVMASTMRLVAEDTPFVLSAGTRNELWTIEPKDVPQPLVP